MSSDISRFIRQIPAASLRRYFEAVHEGLTEGVEWDESERTVKRQLLDLAEGLVGQSLARLTSDAERVNALADGVGQSILSHLIQKTERETYFALANEFDRSLWIYLTDIVRFQRAEEHRYIDVRRDGRLWDAFIGTKDASVSNDPEHFEQFKAQLLDRYRSAGQVYVEIHKRTRLGSDDCEVELFQIMVYREDLPSTQKAFEDQRIVSKIVRPVIEMALTYEPKCGSIEVIADGGEHRQFIAKAFSEYLLQSPIAGEKIPLKHYEIQKLLKSMVLSVEPGDGLEWARVTMLKVSPPNSNNSFTLEVSHSDIQTIYEVSRKYFGDNDPLQAGFRLLQVRITNLCPMPTVAVGKFCM
jgi:hypothetical protein